MNITIAKPLFLTTLSLIFLLLACSNPSEEEENNNDNWEWRDELTKAHSTLLYDTGSIVTGDTVWYDVTVQKGYTYVFEYEGGSENGSSDISIGVSILAPDSTFVGDYGYRTTFKPSVTGTYKIGVVVWWSYNDAPGPFYYMISMREFEPIPDEFSGKWLLIKTIDSAFGGKRENFYSLSNAKEVLEFSGDSITTYHFFPPYDSISSYSYFFAGTSESEKEYAVSENYLILSETSDYGSYTEVYERYSGAVEELTWHVREDFEVPEELLGTWYFSYYKRKEADNILGDFEYDSSEASYNSIGEANCIYVISRDSVTEYRKEGGWKASKSTTPKNDNYNLLTRSSRIHDQLIYEEYYTNVSIDDDGTETFQSTMRIEKYSKYTGELPPKEWTEIVLPTSYTTLYPGKDFTEAFNKGDSLWFQIPVIKDENYQFEVTSDGFNSYLYMISEDKTLLNDTFWASRLNFTANYNGYYYILLTAGYAVSEDASFSVSFTFDN